MSTQPQTSPPGTQASPLSPASLAEIVRLDGVQWDSDGETLVWLEGRSGKGILFARQGDDAPRDLTGDLSVRAEVGYGGGDFTVHQGWAYFAVHKTGRLYRRALDGGTTVAITPPFGQASSPVVSPDGKWVVYVHHDDAGQDRLAVVAATGERWPQILVSGHDFYMQPRFNPAGDTLAWIAWDHPQMPWDGTSLFVADVVQSALDCPRLTNIRKLAGDESTAIFQPEFTADGQGLLYVSDEGGWGAIIHHELASGVRRRLTRPGREYGTPAWSQGQRTFAVAGAGLVVAVGSCQGFQRLEKIDLVQGSSEPLESLGYLTEITTVAACSRSGRVALIGSSVQGSPRVLSLDPDLRQPRIEARASGEMVPAAALATCETLTWPTALGEVCHGLLYLPPSPSAGPTTAAMGSTASSGPAAAGRDTKPPLMVLVHGGPTGQSKAGWRADAQFFATRGYAVLLVNYRGSTGYGRDYMLRLRGEWGVLDVQDVVSGARHLTERGLVDGTRTVIMGGSAGGFTVLQTMVAEPTAFTAGVCLFGVANQFDLAADTHKFESRYLDSLLGPLPAAAAIYRDRSPVLHAERIQRPLAVYQGAIDTVVPRQQSDDIVAALKRTGVPHVYHVYEGEGHGWRKRETIEHFYTSVESFLRRHVLFA